MLQTEEQRRWWFATHPEFSRHRTGERTGTHENGGKESSKVSPEAVDEYVDSMLPYQDGPVADLLRSIKRNFGTEGEKGRYYQRIAREDRPPPRSGNGGAGAGKDDDDESLSFWEAVALGAENSLQDLEHLFGIDLGLTNSSRKLARNLERAGKPRPPGHQAHHIVPDNEGRYEGAEEARRILEKFKIGINNIENGVWLPGKPGTGPGSYHPGLHTKKYYRWVYNSLRKATTRQEAIDILRRIAHRLSSGTFPK